MAVRRFRQAAPRPARQEARLLRKLCSSGGSQDRSGNDPVQGRIDPGLVSPPARIQRRPASGDHRHSRHGQFQGDQRGAGQRPLDDEGRCCLGHRRTRPIRKPAAWNLRLDAELDRRRAGGDGLAGAAPGGRPAEGRGPSFGSSFGTIVAATEPRVAATAVISTCLEPGCHAIFEEASPTFKKRFMWMSNYTDDSKFNEFVKTLTWEGHVEKIRNPYLVVAGEADELSPLEHTERMIRAMSGPRQLVIYADSRHSVGNVPAANLGPFPPTLVADWLMARLNGKPLRSERWLVESTGRVVKGTL